MLEQIPKYNYHTHTARNGHSEICSDLDIVSMAKKVGITTLGFSEHLPNPDLTLPDEDHRMLLLEIEDYLSSINNIIDHNKDMTILSGFEAEFVTARESFLCEMRDKVDYMILGQHFVQNGQKIVNPNNNPNYPIEYASMLIKGIESGIFDIVAHPDIFMKYRDTIKNEEDKKLFDENVILASHIICEKAKEMNIPLEINLRQAELNKYLSDGNLSYPHPIFWQIASEIDGLEVICGIDSHSLNAYISLPDTFSRIKDIIEIIKDKLILNDYNPKNARLNNQKLKDAYAYTKDNALSYYTIIVDNIMNDSTSNANNNERLESTFKKIGNALSLIEESITEQAKEKQKNISREITSITDKYTLNRKRKAIEEVNMVLERQLALISVIKQSIIKATDLGCKTKEEFINIVSQMIELETTNIIKHREQIKDNLSHYSQNIQGLDKTKIYQLKKDNSNSSGYINIMLIILLIGILVFISINVGIFILNI